MPYTINEHRHRFASWAAGRAASVKGCRFSAEQSKAVIEKVGMNQLLASVDLLPRPTEVDGQHRLWRMKVIKAAATSYGLNFAHGVAAKLINVYLKAGFVCGGHHDDARVQALHPPIDGLLLKELR